MKKIISLLYICLLCCVLVACSSAGGISTYTAAVEKMPVNFDPQIADNSEDILVLMNIFDGLFEKQDGHIVKNLAEDYTVSPDGTTYTITIKQDNDYHYKGDTDRKNRFEGVQVKAKDFVFAIERILDRRTQSPYYDDFSNVKKVTATGDFTLEIQLNKADYNFTEKLCLSAAFPCNQEFFATCGGAYGLSVDNILSNGPFKLNYLDVENGNATIVSTRETDGDKISRIRIVQKKPEEIVNSYLNDEISGYLAYSDNGNLPEDTAVTEFESANISLVFNTQKTVFANENIRQALAWYAYGFENSGANMNAVNSCDTVFPGTLTLAGEYINSLYNPVRPAYMSALPKDLLANGFAQLGISKLTASTILMPTDSLYTPVFENINQLWQKDLGQFFTIEYLPVSEIQTRITKADFDMAFLPVTPLNDTAYGILDYYAAFDSTTAGYVQTAKAQTDQKNAIGSIVSAADSLLERALAVPMGSEKTVFYHRSYFENIYVDPFTSVINLKHTVVK